MTVVKIIYEVLPIEMLPILVNVMSLGPWSFQFWVCQGSILKMGWSLG